MRRQVIRTRANRSGFTLVELLVVIAIIGTLVGLLLPAVQAAREAARSNTCRNNLKQLYLGMEQFNSSQGNLPGYVNELVDPNNPGVGRRASWVVMMFPYIEQGPLWEKWSNEVPGTSNYLNAQWNRLPTDPSIGNVAPEIELLQCPSDPAEGEGFPFLSYVVNAGQALGDTSRGGQPTDPDSCNSVPGLGSSTGARNCLNEEYVGNGVFFDLAKLSGFPGDNHFGSTRLKTSIDYVQANDGTSRTLMISENIHAVYWAYDEAPSSTSSPAALDLSEVPDAKHLFGFVWQNGAPSGEEEIRRINGGSNELTPENLTDLRNAEQLGYPNAQHPTGVNVAFCDSHVEFMSDNVSSRVYAQLMTSNRKRSKFFAPQNGTNTPDRDLAQPSDADF